MKRQHSINNDTQPRSAVVKSLMAADEETRRWEKAQLIRNIIDADGTSWSIVILREEGYLSDKFSNIFGLKIDVKLKCVVERKSLVEAQVYCPEKDARLLELLGTQKIPIELKALYLESTDFGGLERELKSRIDHLAAQTAEISLKSLKRKVIQQWIDASKGFGIK